MLQIYLDTVMPHIYPDTVIPQIYLDTVIPHIYPDTHAPDIPGHCHVPDIPGHCHQSMLCWPQFDFCINVLFGNVLLGIMKQDVYGKGTFS